MKRVLASLLAISPALVACGDDTPERKNPVSGEVRIVVHDEFSYGDAYGFGRPECERIDLGMPFDAAEPYVRIDGPDGKKLETVPLPETAELDDKDDADKTDDICQTETSVSLTRTGDVTVELFDMYGESVGKETLELDQDSVTLVV